MNRAIKYRLYPNKEQAILIDKTIGCARKVYNLMLNDKVEYYKANKAMLNNSPAQYKKDYPFLKEVDSLALANASQNLNKAYKSFFKNKNIGFPKFKSKKRSRLSYTTNNQKGSIRINGSKIKIPKLGFVRASIHRKAKKDWLLKSATISKDSCGKYYISVLYEFEYKINYIDISNTDELNIIGLDYKSNGLYMDSDGNKAFGSNKFFRQYEKRLAKAQKKLKNKNVGSKNCYKQILKINKIHNKIKNKRLDYLRKLSTKIVNLYDVVCIENLNIKALSNKGFGNGKATLDNGYGMFTTMLEYKLNERGKYFIKIDKWYPSSQICSNCGNKQKITLDQRAYICPKCGKIIDRDYNAAINIKNEGIRLIKSIN
ncbi:transposase [Anaerococcus sp. AGMB09787]|uniref:transposase n=1 Tax=Anaerococcus sp. AGMB09787 TaxID=2922869 RepID=UPI001FAEFB15|nr:transposase [Anaerococcus sp. AGMB09787]